MSNDNSDLEKVYEKIGIQNIVIIDGVKNLQNHRDQIPPEIVDLSQHLHFIRRQGGLGCWGYSFLAMWDIMNEIVCPYSPNLSFRLWKTFFYKQQIWKENGDIYSPDGRYHDITVGALNLGNPPFFKSFGCTTEGTDPSLHNYPARYSDVGWSVEGINEAYNYRIESDRVPIAVNSQTFMQWLADSHPIQVSGGVHVVTVVGYNKNTQTFTIVDSAGDKAGNGGYRTITFSQLNNNQPLWFLQGHISNAYILPKWNHISPPKPVLAARIHVRHNDDRGNIHLWLGVEDSPLPKQKIWPHGWDDNSRSLHFTVRLPSEFIWPPSKDNRIILELYDAATYSNSGGEIIEFSVAFGGQVIKCSKLAANPLTFNSNDRLFLSIP